MTAKRPTITDIARRAGVSTGAVSYALNGQPGVSTQTRERILQIADEVGWRPSLAARSLTGSRAHAVALVLERTPETLGVEPFFMQFIAGIEAELAQRRTGLLLQLVPDHAGAADAIRSWWSERRIDGVILTDLWGTDPRVPVVAGLGIPAVVVGNPLADAALPAVWSDDVAAVGTVIDGLVALGHRSIARVAGLPELEHTRVRIDAHGTAMRRHGLPGDDVVVTDYSPDAGARATRELLTRATPPTAIAYDNDVMAVAGLGVARELGVAVPDQLSIVAGDDSQLCTLVHPALTALSRDVSAYGRLAARTLLAAIDGEGPTDVRDVTAVLVERGSTAPPAVRDEPVVSSATGRRSGARSGTAATRPGRRGGPRRAAQDG